MSVSEKRTCIEPEIPGVSIVRQCELLRLPRSSYYRSGGNLSGVSQEDLKLMRLIDEEYTRHPFYGSRKIRIFLRRQGYPVNRKRVQRLMRRMGIQSIAPKPNTSVPRRDHKVYPYLLKGTNINRPNMVWCSDITYIRLSGGFVYLTAIMDWHSRYVLSWEISVTMDDDFCVNALDSAIRRYGRPNIFNTDQGTQYTGKHFTGVLQEHGIRISMDGKGRAMDNVFIERLWRSVKYEKIYLHDFQNVKELVKELKQYFDFYNFERPHQSLDDKTPAEIYWGPGLARAAA
ncbi:MAG: IS3 family transposase [Desulfobulbaceae bacterium]|nr:MAG: IS3 family transposase [Desulfobulbaceae bacterium]